MKSESSGAPGLFESRGEWCKSILADPKLTAPTVRVAFAVFRALPLTFRASFRTTDLASASCTTERTVDAAILRLRQLGYIEARRGDQCWGIRLLVARPVRRRPRGRSSSA